jgi:hypothetical protein
MTHMIDGPMSACGGGLHWQRAADEPVFHYVEPDGNHGIAGLGTAKTWARGMREDGIPLSEVVHDLYVLLPGAREMIRVTLTVVDGKDGDELEVEALRPTVLDSNVVYTCKL